MSRNLTITRKKAIQGCAIEYYVRVNEKAVARLYNGETVTIPIPAESVTLDVLAKVMKSETITIPAGINNVRAEVYQKMGLWSTTLHVRLI